MLTKTQLGNPMPDSNPGSGLGCPDPQQRRWQATPTAPLASGAQQRGLQAAPTAPLASVAQYRRLQAAPTACKRRSIAPLANDTNSATCTQRSTAPPASGAHSDALRQKCCKKYNGHPCPRQKCCKKYDLGILPRRNACRKYSLGILPIRNACKKYHLGIRFPRLGIGFPNCIFYNTFVACTARHKMFVNNTVWETLGIHGHRCPREKCCRKYNLGNLGRPWASMPAR